MDVLRSAVRYKPGTALRRAQSMTVYKFVCAIASTFMAVWPALGIAATAPVTLLTIDGAIGPATADYVTRGISRAAQDGSQLVILKMDTPGGLDTSMRSIIKTILASPVAVASYVGPGGARAASAGTYILYASHVAAMAPGTNLGAATPVQIGMPTDPERDKPASPRKDDKPDSKPGRADPADNATTSPMTSKQINDAAAYIRGLAQMRGRNADWAERAVREAVSLPADEALKLRAVDFVATDIPGLIAQLDGKRVNTLGQEKLLQTKGAAVIDARPDWRTNLLAAITNPSIALLLMTIGVYGLMFEFMNPGFGIPGVVGAICLLLGLYALQLLPVNYAGLALILLGMIFMIAEAFFPSFGVLGFGGIVSFVTGALILIDTELPGYGIPPSLIATMAIVSALLFAGTAAMALKTRRRPVVSGAAGLIGSVAEVLEAGQGEGWVRLDGEIWRVLSSSSLVQGQKVEVVARNGLVLEVVPIDNHTKGE